MPSISSKFIEDTNERKATVFLDRDGVINKKRPEGFYVTSWEEFVFLPGAVEGCRRLTEAGIRTIVVTNQRGVARGVMSISRLEEIHRRMQEEMREAGAVIDAIYFCPHDYGQCDCRKPDVGLFLQAKRDFPDILFSESAVIGDSLGDMEAGTRMGCTTIMVCKEEIGALETDRNIRIDMAATSLYAAVDAYLAVLRPLK